MYSLFKCGLAASTYLVCNYIKIFKTRGDVFSTKGVIR